MTRTSMDFKCSSWRLEYDNDMLDLKGEIFSYSFKIEKEKQIN